MEGEERMRAGEAVAVHGLARRYRVADDQEIVALDDVSFTVARSPPRR
jgi:hypothetical protein